MAKRIPLSFKETDRDCKLYDIVSKQGDKSNFIKDAIEFYINSRLSSTQQKINQGEIYEDEDEILNIISK